MTTVRQIAAIVAAYFQISLDSIYGKKPATARYRWIVFYLCRHELKLTFSEIARSFHCDHTTVMSGARAIEREQWEWADALEACRSAIVHRAIAAPRTHCPSCGQSLDAEQLAKSEYRATLGEIMMTISKRLEAA